MTLPKLHLRDLFWLVLVIAIGYAWMMDTVRRHSGDEYNPRIYHRMATEEQPWD